MSFDAAKMSGVPFPTYCVKSSRVLDDRRAPIFRKRRFDVFSIFGSPPWGIFRKFSEDDILEFPSGHFATIRESIGRIVSKIVDFKGLAET
jgi:hypothetical protein